MIIKTLISNPSFPFSYISDFPDHATFREKGGNNGESDKLDVFLSLVSASKLSSIMVYKKNNVDPVVTLCWCVCLTVSNPNTPTFLLLTLLFTYTLLLHLPFYCTHLSITHNLLLHLTLCCTTFYYTYPSITLTLIVR